MQFAQRNGIIDTIIAQRNGIVCRRLVSGFGVADRERLPELKYATFLLLDICRLSSMPDQE